MRRNIFIIIALAVIAFCVLSVSCKNEVDEVKVDASYKELKEALQEIAGIEIPDIPGIRVLITQKTQYSLYSMLTGDITQENYSKILSAFTGKLGAEREGYPQNENSTTTDEWHQGDNWTQLIFVNDSKPYMNINCER